MAVVKLVQKGLIGYQARWKGKTKYFALSENCPDAYEKACAVEAKMKLDNPTTPRVYKPRSNIGISGISLTWRKSTSFDYLYVQSTFIKDKRPFTKGYALSTRKYPLIISRINVLRAQHNLPLIDANHAIMALAKYVNTHGYKRKKRK